MGSFNFRMEGDVDSGMEEDEVLLRRQRSFQKFPDRERKSTIFYRNNENMGQISEELNHKDREEKSKELHLLPDKGMGVRNKFIAVLSPFVLMILVSFIIYICHKVIKHILLVLKHF